MKLTREEKYEKAIADKSYKSFGGKRYYFTTWTYSKKEAEKIAKDYRKKGYLARIIKDPTFARQYHIYTRPGSYLLT